MQSVADSDRFPSPEAIPSAIAVQPLHQREYLMNGVLHSWAGEVQEVRSPVCVRQAEALEQVLLGGFPLLSKEKALEMLDAAVRAYDLGRGEWPAMRVEERLAAMQRFAQAMKAQRQPVVKLLMWEIGKTLADSEKEFDRTVRYIEDTIEALKELDRHSSRFVIDEGIAAQIRRAPLGTVLCMGPFNYPLNETFTTLIPALIMGNTVVLKPAKLGVLLLQPLLAAFRDCFPPGVVNVLYGKGSEVIGPLMESGKVDVLAFIGSARVANLLIKAHPRPNRLRSILGLNAKNPAIILPHADLAQAAAECLLGAFSFNGQRCTAIKIIFVHEEIAEAFLKAFSLQLEALPLGMPWEPQARITPLPEENKPQLMDAYVQDALAHGAKVINAGGGSIDATLFTPAALYPVNEAMRLYHEEQFGPVIPIVPYKKIEDALAYIEQSNFGQQVSIFGTDAEQIAPLIDPLVNQVSRVNINSQSQRGPDTFPFTGRKDSAEGTLSVADALRAFSIRALVAAKMNDRNKEIVSRIVRERRSNFLSTDFIL